MDNVIEAAEIKLVDFFREPMQMIATNARGYHWTREQCKKLLSDIVRAAKEDRIASHYIGTMIYVEHGILARTPIPRYLLIDGQQRLATISLILLASEEAEDGHKNPLKQEIRDTLLYNTQGRKDFRYKLVLMGGDQDAFLRIARGEPQPTDCPSGLADNFNYIRDLMAKRGIDPDLVYRGIAKLTFMPISTDQPYENPRFVRQSIDETGLDDEQKSLVQNWLHLLTTI